MMIDYPHDSGRSRYNSSKVVEFLIIIFLFLITLQSFYWEKIGFSAFPVLGTIGLFLVSIWLGFRWSNSAIISRFSIFYLFLFLFLFYVSIIEFYFQEDYKSLFSSIITLVAVFSSFIVFHNNQNKIHAILGSVIVLHLFFFYLQVAVWVSLDYYIDYVAFLSDDYSVFSSSKGLFLLDRRIPRFTGLFNEPATYSTWLFVIVSLNYFVRPRVSWLLSFSLLSIILSMSLFGFIIVAVMMLITFFTKTSLSLFVRAFPIYFVVALALMELIYERVASKWFELDYRLAAIENITEPTVLLFGRISGQSCGMDVSVSLVTSLICNGGMHYILMFLLVLHFSRVFKSPLTLVFVSVLLISKIKITYPLFWIFLTLVLVISFLDRRQVANNVTIHLSKAHY